MPKNNICECILPPCDDGEDAPMVEKLKFSLMLCELSDSEWKKFVDDLANLIYEKSNHEIPKDICLKQALYHAKEQIKRPYTTSMERIANIIVWAFEQ